MKKIETLIRPDKFPDVQMALDNLGSPGMTVTEIRGHGVQKGLSHHWREETIKVDLLPKLKIETVVQDQDVPITVEAILEAAKTGQAGDGKIFVTSVEEVYRIRTKESGERAIS